MRLRAFDHRRAMLLYPVLAFALALLAAPAAAAPELRSPTGKWVIDYAEHQCTASRAFGTADKPLHFVIKPSPGGEVTKIVLIENGANFDGHQDDATIILDGGQKLRTTQLAYGLSKKRFRMINLDVAQTAALGRSSSIRWGSEGNGALALGPMAQVIKVLEDCRRDLRRYWNMEPELRDKLTSGPKLEKSIYSYFTTDDYPSQALSREQSGVTAFVLLIDEKGRMRDCMIEQTSGIATLDISACLVIAQRSKFLPAIGADGKPVRASISSRVRWVLP